MGVTSQDLAAETLAIKFVCNCQVRLSQNWYITSFKSKKIIIFFEVFKMFLSGQHRKWQCQKVVDARQSH